MACFNTICRPSSKIARTLAVFFALVSLSGCWVRSIHPLYDDVSSKDPDVVFEKSLVGSWSVLDEKCETILTLGGDHEAYDLGRTERGEGCSRASENRRYEAHLVKLESHYFLDISQIGENVCDL